MIHPPKEKGPGEGLPGVNWSSHGHRQLEGEPRQKTSPKSKGLNGWPGSKSSRKALFRAQPDGEGQLGGQPLIGKSQLARKVPSRLIET